LDSRSGTLRDRLLSEAERFVRAAVRLEGIRSISLLGSIVTSKQEPKDIDFLVVVDDEADLAPLAKCARQLQGRAQSMNRGADVFLANPGGAYLGRTCRWRECGPGIRQACDALRCGRRQYLHDDLEDIRLTPEMVADPPVRVWPAIETRGSVPTDVERFLERLKHAA
jgi:predicted nucleotidyltransferase